MDLDVPPRSFLCAWDEYLHVFCLCVSCSCSCSSIMVFKTLPSRSTSTSTSTTSYGYVFSPCPRESSAIFAPARLLSVSTEEGCEMLMPRDVCRSLLLRRRDSRWQCGENKGAAYLCNQIQSNRVMCRCCSSTARADCLLRFLLLDSMLHSVLHSPQAISLLMPHLDLG